MKFAKELEQELVPEWRVKYLNYKTGKKHIKAVSRAIHRANATPSLARRPDLPTRVPTFSSFLRTPRADAPDATSESARLPSSPPPARRDAVPGRTPPQPIPASGERDGLANSPGPQLQYGSFVETPPPGSPTATSAAATAAAAAPQNDSTFELPAPAMKVPSHADQPPKRPSMSLSGSTSRHPFRSKTISGPLPSHRSSIPPPDRTPRSIPRTPRQRLTGFLTGASTLGRRVSPGDFAGEEMDEVRERERDFFSFLDRELEKVETFYLQKEEQAGKRLELLRQQLHEMRNRRIEEIAAIKSRKVREQHAQNNGDAISGDQKSSDDPQEEDAKDQPLRSWVDPIKGRIFKPGPNSKALQRMVHTPVMAGMPIGDRRDYIRRPEDQDVPYRTAKRKLKIALQEFYRGLELLKAYSLLNRTAFRKLNKKYDKAVNARPPYRYMTEKVNKTWFVNSDVLDGHIVAVEDLYTRYFEKGNHKIAVGKLRSLTKKPADQSSTTFRSGVLIGTGLVFAIQGLVHGCQLLFNSDEDDDGDSMRTQTAYLLQIYGGYFLMLFIFMLFCLDCSIWTKYKVNYPFIFELDPRTYLDWRELAEFPSFFLFLFGFFLWLNFSRYGNPAMYLYYPVILIFITLLVLFFPAPILRHKSRNWFLYSHFRLFFAGLYPVEFRDFFLGDIYCSLTYATCNVELLFCLYANRWDDPVQCNSNHSRLLGFFSALPPIWRALQCIRRYYDTRHVFPHLVNCGKYSMSIMAAVCLSLYRIENSRSNIALFIAFSTINGIYCSIWDLFMDFSLLQPNSRHPLLRDILALRKRWLYYSAMTLDPILRFAWIFYAIFTHDSQHSTVVSFLVGLAEVSRRGMWTLFRVENEHAANVALYRASRDLPLPYRLQPAAVFDEQQQQQEGQGRPGPPGRAASDEGGIAAATATASGLHPSPLPPLPGSGAVAPASSAPPSIGRSTALDNTSTAAVATTAVTAAVTTIGTPTSVLATGAEQKTAQQAAQQAQEGGGGGGGVGATTQTDTVAGPLEEPEAATGTVRRRRGSTFRRTETFRRRSIARIMAEAHKEDFEKKRRPEDGVGPGGSGGGGAGGGGSGRSGRQGGSGSLQGNEDEDDDDDDDEEDNEYLDSIIQDRMEVRETHGLIRSGKRGEDSD